MSLPTTIASLVSELEDGRPPEHRLGLDVGGCRLDVATNHEGLHGALRRYFADWITPPPDVPDFRIVALEGPALRREWPWVVKQPDPGKSRIKEEYLDLPDGRVVRKRLTGMVFAFGGDTHVAYGPCARNDNQVVNFVNNRYMQWRLRQGYLLAHAGAVGRDGRALALSGPSGAGKSTAALRLVARGLDFVTNDRLLLRAGHAGVEVQGIPKHPRVNPGTIVHNPVLESLISDARRRRMLALPPEELKALENKHDVIVPELFGPGRFRLSARLEALVVFNWNPAEGEARADEVDLRLRPDLLDLVVKSPGLFYDAGPGEAPPDLSEAAYLHVLSGRPVLEITGRQDFAAAEALCLEILEAWNPAR